MNWLLQRIRHLHTLIFLMLVSISSIGLLIGLIINYNFQQELLISQTMTMAQQNVIRTTESLQAMISTLDVSTEAIVRQLTLGNITKADWHSLLNNTVALNRDILSIAIVDAQDTIQEFAPIRFHLKENVQLTKQNWYQADLQYDQSLYSAPHVQNLFDKQYPWVISNTIPFRYANERYLLVIDYKLDTLHRFFQEGNIGAQGYSFILNQQHEIIYHPQQQLIASDLKQEELSSLTNANQETVLLPSTQTILSSKKMAGTGWYIVGKTDLKEMIASATHNLIMNSFKLFVALSIATAIIAFFIARYIAKPIRRLSEQMRQVESTEAIQGALLVPNKPAPYTEAMQLQQSYQQLLTQVSHLMGTIKREEAALRKSERNVLDAQIRPHFLYNTLESILWMIESNNTSQASSMVRSLGKLLRITLSKGAEFIPLEKEFEHVSSYLEIQRMRYNEQFDYQLDLPANLSHYYTIKLILQPIVENAILHGVSTLVDPGFIHIQAQQQQHTLQLMVKDNGQGMTEKQVQQLRHHLIQRQKQLGIGVRNVHERLQIYYGKDYGIQIESELDEGTTVILTLPLQTEQEVQSHDHP